MLTAANPSLFASNRHASEEEAALAYDRAAALLLGPAATLNFKHPDATDPWAMMHTAILLEQTLGVDTPASVSAVARGEGIPRDLAIAVLANKNNRVRLDARTVLAFQRQRQHVAHPQFPVALPPTQQAQHAAQPRRLNFDAHENDTLLEALWQPDAAAELLAAGGSTPPASTSSSAAPTTARHTPGLLPPTMLRPRMPPLAPGVTGFSNQALAPAASWVADTPGVAYQVPTPTDEECLTATELQAIQLWEHEWAFATAAVATAAAAVARVSNTMDPERGHAWTQSGAPVDLQGQLLLWPFPSSQCGHGGLRAIVPPADALAPRPYPDADASLDQASSRRGPTFLCTEALKHIELLIQAHPEVLLLALQRAGPMLPRHAAAEDTHARACAALAAVVEQRFTATNHMTEAGALGIDCRSVPAPGMATSEDLPCPISGPSTCINVPLLSSISFPFSCMRMPLGPLESTSL
jgi:hypothetical protein